MSVGTAKTVRIISGAITANELSSAREKLKERYKTECGMPYNQPDKKPRKRDDRER